MLVTSIFSFSKNVFIKHLSKSRRVVKSRNCKVKSQCITDWQFTTSSQSMTIFVFIFFNKNSFTLVAVVFFVHFLVCWSYHIPNSISISLFFKFLIKRKKDYICFSDLHTFSPLFYIKYT